MLRVHFLLLKAMGSELEEPKRLCETNGGEKIENYNMKWIIQAIWQ